MHTHCKRSAPSAAIPHSTGCTWSSALGPTHNVSCCWRSSGGPPHPSERIPPPGSTAPEARYHSARGHSRGTDTELPGSGSTSAGHRTCSTKVASCTDSVVWHTSRNWFPRALRWCSGTASSSYSTRSAPVSNVHNSPHGRSSRSSHLDAPDWPVMLPGSCCCRAGWAGTLVCVCKERDIRDQYIDLAPELYLWIYYIRDLSLIPNLIARGLE